MLPQDWEKRSDIVLPSFVSRNNILSVWVFDLDNDALHLYKLGSNFIPTHCKISIAALITFTVNFSNLLNLGSMMQISIPPLPKHLAFRPNVLSIPSLGPAKDRTFLFLERLLTDFRNQWLNVLVGRYNESTFRKFAYAVRKLVTLDFEVREERNSSQREGTMAVPHGAIPPWDPIQDDIFMLGDVSVVLSQHISIASDIMHKDYDKKLNDPDRTVVPGSRERYILFTLRRLSYCVFNHNGTFTECPSQRLFDVDHENIKNASGLPFGLISGIHLLIAAMQTGRLEVTTDAPNGDDLATLGDVPPPIDEARRRCVHNSGGPWNWMQHGHPVQKVELFSRLPNHTVPKESFIYFGDHFSGLAYGTLAETVTVAVG